MRQDISFKNCEHSHNPSSFSNPLMRFLDFVIRPGRVYFPHDNTGICGVCGQPICVPSSYYSWKVNAIYYFSSALSVVIAYIVSACIVSIMKFWMFAIVLLWWPNWRITTAAVLAFSQWEQYDASKDAAEKDWASAKKDRVKKFMRTTYGGFFGIGIIAAVFL